jgi:hypothetical protein
MAGEDSKALRAFLVDARAARTAIQTVLVSVEKLFSELIKEKLLTVKATPTVLRVVAANRVVYLTGLAHRQDAQVVPCIAFSVDARPIHLKLLLLGGTWTWSDGAGLGVDGQPISSETTSKVFLTLLSGGA